MRDPLAVLGPAKASVVGVVLAAALGAALYGAPLVQQLDCKLLDLEFALLRVIAPRAVTTDVAVVGIDRETLHRLREPIALWHHHLGDFLMAMLAAKASTVGLDVILPDRSYDFLAPGYDRALLSGLLAVKGKLPVVLGRTVDERGNLYPIYPPFLSIAGPDASGLVLMPLDADGTLRRYDDDLAEGRIAMLAGQMARTLKITPSSGIIDFSLGRAFSYVPLGTVLDWWKAGDAAALQAAFRGRPVLLGSVLPLADRQELPVPLAAWEPNSRDVPDVLVHAQVLRSLMGPGMIKPAPASWGWALTLLAAFAWLLGGRPARGMLLLSSLAAVAAGLSTWLLWQGQFLPLTAVLLTGLFAVGGRIAFEVLLQVRERRRLRRIFTGYVSPQIMEEILDGRLAVGLGGERKNICVLFCDMRDFTPRSESMSPEAAIDLLNRYFEQMTLAVHGNGGTVDKFIGDCVMAFFGAPKRLDNPCRQAFLAAQEMLQRLCDLNRSLHAEGAPPICVGIGLHVGEAVVGHVGARSRHEFTVIGDVVNVASRLEGLSKELEYPVLCSAEVVSALADHARQFVALGVKPIKGHTAIMVYGWPPEQQTGQQEAEQQTG